MKNRLAAAIITAGIITSLAVTSAVSAAPQGSDIANLTQQTAAASENAEDSQSAAADDSSDFSISENDWSDILDSDNESYINGIDNLTAEEKEKAIAAYNRMDELSEKLFALFDNDFNIRSGSEAEAEELENQILETSDSIADIEKKIEDHETEEYVNSLESLTDAEKTEMLADYREIDGLVDRINVLYDEQGNVLSGSEAAEQDLQNQIDAVREKLKVFEEKEYGSEMAGFMNSLDGLTNKDLMGFISAFV